MPSRHQARNFFQPADAINELGSMSDVKFLHETGRVYEIREVRECS